MNKPWQIWLVLALIFCAGGVSGGLVAYHVAEKNSHHMRPPEEWGRRHYRYIARALDLTPAQRKEVQPIVQQNIEALVELRHQDMRKAWEILQRMELEITAHLTPEQKAKYEDLLRRREKFIKRWRKQRAERAGHLPPPVRGPNGGKRLLLRKRAPDIDPVAPEATAGLPVTGRAGFLRAWTHRWQAGKSSWA